MTRGIQKKVARATATRKLTTAERDAVYADVPDIIRYWPTGVPPESPKPQTRPYVSIVVRRQWTKETRAWLRNLRPAARAWMAMLKATDRQAWQRVIDDRNAEFIAAAEQAAPEEGS